jgi:hypothetical protein
MFCSTLVMDLAPMLGTIMRKCIVTMMLMSVIALSGISAMAGAPPPPPKGPQPGPQPGPPPGAWPGGDKKWPGFGVWPGGDKKWPNPDWALDAATKRLEQLKSTSQPGPEIEFICSRTADLLERSKQSRDNPFKSERLLNAANALLGAGDLIVLSRKTDRPRQEWDYWGMTGTALMGCFSRIRQADFFAPMSGEKKSEQYATTARSLYQQAGSAYGSRDYQKAMFLVQASESIVFALESIAQASIPMPKPPLFK